MDAPTFLKRVFSAVNSTNFGGAIARREITGPNSMKVTFWNGHVFEITVKESCANPISLNDGKEMDSSLWEKLFGSRRSFEENYTNGPI